MFDPEQWGTGAAIAAALFSFIGLGVNLFVANKQAETQRQLQSENARLARELEDLKHERARRGSKVERLRPVYADLLDAVDIWQSLVPRHEGIYKGETPEQRAKVFSEQFAIAAEKMNRARGLAEIETGTEEALIVFENARRAFLNVRVMRGLNEETRHSMPPDEIWEAIGVLETSHIRLRALARGHLESLAE